MLTLIENGEVYAPERVGRASLLLAGGRVLKVGPVERRALDLLGVDYEAIDAAGRLVTPGLIDPHEHLLGGSGERGFASQTPEICLSELALAGITTVVGCLGVDATTKTMPGLLARAKALREEGLTAYLYTGGYGVPPSTILRTVREDVLFIEEVIGAGEIAISDLRSTQPSPAELARVISDARAGGLLSGKAGVTHFHVGDGPRRLAPLRALLDEYDVDPSSLYPTHVERSTALMDEAIELTGRGVVVDVDVVERDLPKWLRRYRESGADLRQLTASSDASITSPRNLHGQVRACVLEHGFPLEEVLPLVTANTARVLKLAGKGRLAEGLDADVLVLERQSLEVVEVIAGGRRLVRDGGLAVCECFLEGSDREVRLTGRPHRG